MSNTAQTPDAGSTKQRGRPTLKTQTLTLSRLVASLVNPNESVLPSLLPAAEREADALIDDGLTDDSIAATTERMLDAGAGPFHDERSREQRARMNAFRLSGEGELSTDDVDSVIYRSIDTAFALGLAVGLRIGGGR